MIDRTRRKWIAPLLVLVLAIAGAAVWFLRPPGATRPPIRNVVIISIDTCRADYLGCYNPDRPLTPNIDKVAREGILFENAISPVPLTLPAHSSMMTGMIPPTHGVQGNGNFRLSPPEPDTRRDPERERVHDGRRRKHVRAGLPVRPGPGIRYV